MNEVYLGAFRRGRHGLPVVMFDERLHTQTPIDELDEAGADRRVAAGFGWQHYPALLAANEDRTRRQARAGRPRDRVRRAGRRRSYRAPPARAVLANAQQTTRITKTRRILTSKHPLLAMLIRLDGGIVVQPKKRLTEARQGRVPTYPVRVTVSKPATLTSRGRHFR